MILVDTSVLIDFFRGTKNKESRKFESVLQMKIPFGINSFIFQEILQGADSDKDYHLLKNYLATQIFYNPKDSVESFAKAARIYMDCRKKGITIRSTIDCIIALTALEHDLFLLHNDNDYVLMQKVVPLKFY
jgi:predicted nucleic acid-binding protein